MYEFQTVKKSQGHLLLDLFRDGMRVGLVMANPYSAKLAVREEAFKDSCLKPEEKMKAQLMATRTVKV